MVHNSLHPGASRICCAAGWTIHGLSAQTKLTPNETINLTLCPCTWTTHPREGGLPFPAIGFEA